MGNLGDCWSHSGRGQDLGNRKSAQNHSDMRTMARNSVGKAWQEWILIARSPEVKRSSCVNRSGN